MISPLFALSPYCLLPFPTSTLHWSISRGGAMSRPFHRYTHNASDNLLPAYPIEASRGKGNCPVSLLRHAHTAPGYLLPAPTPGASPVRDVYITLFQRYTHTAVCHLLPSYPVGASRGRGPYHVFSHRHAHAASGCLLPEPQQCISQEDRISYHVSTLNPCRIRPSPTSPPS